MLTAKVLALAIFTVINSQPQYWRESCPPKPGVTLPCETKDERAKRLKLASIAMAQASLKRPGGWEAIRVAAALVTLGNEETHWARYVWEGCLEFPHPEAARCDPLKAKGGKVYPQSLTFWQLKARACSIVHMPTTPLEDPRLMWSHEWSVRQAFNGARCAAKLFVGAHTRCGSLAGAFGGYRSIHCGWPEGKKRAKAMQWAESRIRQEVIRASSHTHSYRVVPRTRRYGDAYYVRGYRERYARLGLETRLQRGRNRNAHRNRVARHILAKDILLVSIHA